MSYDISWHNMTSCDASHTEEALRCKDRVIGIIWHHMICYDIMWYHNISHDSHCDEVRTGSVHCDRPTQLCTYDIIWYKIISYCVIWYHMIHFYRKKRSTALPTPLNTIRIVLLASYDIIWYVMISCDIIWQPLWRSSNRKRALWSADTTVHLWYNMI